MASQAAAPSRSCSASTLRLTSHTLAATCPHGVLRTSRTDEKPLSRVVARQRGGSTVATGTSTVVGRLDCGDRRAGLQQSANRSAGADQAFGSATALGVRDQAGLPVLAPARLAGEDSAHSLIHPACFAGAVRTAEVDRSAGGPRGVAEYGRGVAECGPCAVVTGLLVPRPVNRSRRSRSL